MHHHRISIDESETRVRFALLAIAVLAILVSMTLLVDLIDQNKTRGERLRAQTVDTGRTGLALSAQAIADPVAATQP